jgi:hypothetical protein
MSPYVTWKLMLEAEERLALLGRHRARLGEEGKGTEMLGREEGREDLEWELELRWLIYLYLCLYLYLALLGRLP